MAMEGRIYALSVLTLVAIKVSYTSTEPVKSDPIDTTSELESRINRLNSLYALLPDDLDTIDRMEKRRSLFRFGKRRSLFRFGKRGGIMRFGKRPDSYDFGDYGASEFLPSEFYTVDEEPYLDSFPYAEKKSSLFRFGKKSRDTSSLFERNAAKEKKPHTPWRFGREEDYIDKEFGINKQ